LTLVTGPRRSLVLKLSDTRVYEPQIRARLGTRMEAKEVVVKVKKLLSGRDPVRAPAHPVSPFFSSLVLSSLELSDTEVYEP